MVTIENDAEEAFIMRHAYGNSWLGMTLKNPGEIPKTWDDGSQVNFINFQPDRPGTEDEKRCVFIHAEQDLER